MTTKRKLGGIAPPSAYEPAPIEPADIEAIRALLRCEATADQQRRFRKWLDAATGVTENPFRPGGPDAARETDFACGKKFVGDQLYSIALAKTGP